MSLPLISIKRPVFGWMATIALFLFGAISLNNLGVSQYPDVDYPMVSVRVGYPGTAPELMETDVVEPLESALTTVEGVQRITSSASYGSASVTLEFDISKDINIAVQDVNAAVQAAIRQLPEDIDPPTIQKRNPEDRPILWLGLSADVPTRDLMFFAKNSVSDRFATVEGVSAVDLGGFLEPVVRVWLDPNKLAQYELTYDDVLASLKSEHKEIPTGQIVGAKSEKALRFLGEAATVKEISELMITKRSGSLLYTKITLGELGKVQAGLEDQRRFARIDGKRSVGISIQKQRGENSVAVAERVRERMAQISLPEGYKLSVNFDTTHEIQKSIHELGVTLIISILLTGVVCWLFLGSISSTINIIIAIPTSIFGTFIVMQWLGYTLNLFTMLALILSVGIIVDDAIMVLENIFKKRETEKNPARAAWLGAEQVQFAAIATSIAIVAIFLPVIYVSGMVGAYLTQFGIVLSVAVLFSTFEALTFTPMRMAGFKDEGEPNGIPGIFSRFVKRAANRYAAWAESTFRSRSKPFAFYAAALVLFGASLATVLSIPTELIPQEETGTMMVRSELPLGTSLEENSRRLEDVEKIIKEQEGILRSYSILGSGGVNQAMLMVTLKDREDRKLTQAQIESQLREKLRTLGKDFKVRLQPTGGVSIGGQSGYPVDLTLRGGAWPDLIKSAQNLESKMQASGLVVDVRQSFDQGNPEIAIIPNREQARLYGVSVETIAETLAFFYNGIDAAKYNDEGKRVDVIVKADPQAAPTNIEGLKKLVIRNSRGQLVPLATLIQARDTLAPVSINRENRERKISLSANLADGQYLGPVLEHMKKLANESVVGDVRYDESSGASGDFNQIFKDLIFALVLGIAVAYMVLGSQFNSYIHPVTVLLALPFSVSGAFFALWVTGSTLNLFSMIGLLLLMGIVKKNSIMLVEFANQGRETKGLSAAAAMVESCRNRFRPILMTAFTTVAAALPPALKIGTDTASSSMMSIGIVGGVIFSTFMTYFVVPIAYVHMSRFEKPHHDLGL
ncbi:MAG TPA: efflux RND transporter permease subunit [Bdellovibrionota bacterium]|nr:efflux RND transporter permease subunit [Bdellovibrionota bacterium]